jgi:hypothetical protein
MSLHQIKHIGSVGRFRAASASGDVTFKKFTLIFGENGRGKTTLCSILRSLQNNDPAIVLGRKTLGEDKEPHIVLTFAGGLVLFKHGEWNSQTTKLRIFDAQYIAENVYFGDSIGTDQRRNLCRVMLGRDGVILAKAYDDADATITAKNNEIKDVRKQLTAYVQTQQIDELIALTEDGEIDDKIEAKAREVEGLREIENLRTQPMLQALEFPAIPSRLKQILGKALLGARDPALRSSFYRRFRPTDFPSWYKFAESDREHFLDSAFHNTNLWRVETDRATLSQLTWNHPDPHSDLMMVNQFRAVEGRMRQQHPEWFND